MGRIHQPKESSALTRLRHSGKIRLAAGDSGSCDSGSCDSGSCDSGSCDSGSCDSGSCRLRQLFERLLGRLAEISGACLTLGLALVVEAQRRREPVAWITAGGATFFPPDAARSGVDLEALVVVRLEDSRALLAAGLARAAESILRSGSFGLVVIDFGSLPGLPATCIFPTTAQSRLLGLAKRHRTACLALREGGPVWGGDPADRASLGSLVALRLEASHQRRAPIGDHREGAHREGDHREGDPPGSFRVVVRVLKDKGGPSPRLRDFELDGNAPDGLR